MPITIVVDSDPHIGPGSRFTLTSDFIGPIPLDWRWNFDVTWEPEGLAWGISVPSDGNHSVSGQIGVMTEGVSRTNLDMVFPAEGTNVLVSAVLTDAGSLTEDSGTRTDLDWTTQGNFIRELEAERLSPGALTAPQVAQLNAIAAATRQDFGGTSIGGILGGLADLVVHPPLEILLEQPSPVVLTGRGSLTHADAVFTVASFGAMLRAFTIPAGFGFRDGAVREYYERIAQFATTHTMQGGSPEVVTELIELRTEGYLWLWDKAFPTRILYDITPGCVVTLNWLWWS